MAAVGTGPISFQGLKDSYLAGGEGDADGNSSFNASDSTTVKLSWFGGASLYKGSKNTVVPSAAATPPETISIDSDFKGRTFGEAGGGSY